jgi:hypothetical protein
MAVTEIAAPVHVAVMAFSLNPPVVRCSCGARVVVRKDGDLRRHLATGEGGEPFPWNDPPEGE